jgi:Sulfatase
MRAFPLFKALVAMTVLLLATGTANAKRPNIVFVLLDDAGFSDLGSYGSEIATPTFDTLAQQGLRFSRPQSQQFCPCGFLPWNSGNFATSSVSSNWAAWAGPRPNSAW